MWRIEHIDVLYWWLLIPAILLYVYYSRRKRRKQLDAIGDAKRIDTLVRSSSHRQNALKRGIWLTAFALLIVALSNPQIGKEEQSVSNRGGNIIVALDLSNSMLARDIAPSRLERSKKLLDNFVQKLSGDKVAFIVFAGKAYVQMPFTTDYGAFKMYLQSIQTDMMPVQGTNLREAIALAESMEGINEGEQKVLVILSDGEDHDKKAVTMAKQAAAKNMIIHTIGVGTPTGATVPEADISEARYKVDAAGQKVVSKLNEDMLRDIAAAGGGKYFNISHERKAVREIQRSIKWSDTNSQEDHIYSQYKSYFQWFLFPAILLLMLELAGVHILSYRENKSVRSFFILFMIIPLIIACGSHTSEATANQYFQDKDYHAAVKTYEEILQKDSALVNWYNLGTSYLKLTELDSAISILQYVLELQPDSNLAFKSNFNLGVAYYEQEEYSQSVNAFKNALKFEPNNYRSQYNLSLALSHILPQDQDQDDDNSEENSNSNDKDGDQDEDQSVDDSQSEGEDGKQDNSNETKDDQSKEENEGSESESKQRENRQNNLSPMDMLKLYQSLDQQEKNIQRRLMEQQGKNQKHPLTEKDW